MEMPDDMQGYFDGRDLSSPLPSENRSALYRHCWETGRREIEGKHFPAAVSRVLAAAAKARDAQTLGAGQ